MGLHSGAPVTPRIFPAPAGTGIVFRRIDLDGYEVEAISRNVAKVSYATSLMKKGVLHLHDRAPALGLHRHGRRQRHRRARQPRSPHPRRQRAALHRDDHRCRLRQQRRKRVYLKILRPYELHEGDKFIGVYPAERYSVSYAIDFPHPLIGSERFQVELSNGSYVEHIAAARTFGFLDSRARC